MIPLHQHLALTSIPSLTAHSSSVSLSVCQLSCDKKRESSLCLMSIFFNYRPIQILNTFFLSKSIVLCFKKCKNIWFCIINKKCTDNINIIFYIWYCFNTNSTFNTFQNLTLECKKYKLYPQLKSYLKKNYFRKLQLVVQ